jgi:hypothetical protein
MRLILLLNLIGMEVLAVLYLRQRRISFFSYLGWGLFSLLLPVVGPFLVILSQPGRPAVRARKRFRTAKRGHLPLSSLFAQFH